MKNLILENASYRYLVRSFTEWLDVQGYAPSTVYNLPGHVNELLHYLEANNTHHIRELNVAIIEQYYQHLKERSNKRRGGGLSQGHLNKHIQALRRFTEYLRKVGRLEIPEIPLKNEESEPQPNYLTVEEIIQLFKATSNPELRKFHASTAIKEAMESRDRAMLAIFYGCGLRRGEGVALDVGDINFDRSLLHVRKGKNYQERFVPISKANLKYLTEYVYDHRPELLKGSKTDALLIGSQYGKRIKGQGLIIRLKKLQYLTANLDLQEKEIGLHTLRHSIATHLLDAGMKLDSISRFLGHNSLESTQIYTHLSADQTKEQPFNNIPQYEAGRLSEDEY